KIQQLLHRVCDICRHTFYPRQVASCPISTFSAVSSTRMTPQLASHSSLHLCTSCCAQWVRSERCTVVPPFAHWNSFSTEPTPPELQLTLVERRLIEQIVPIMCM